MYIQSEPHTTHGIKIMIKYDNSLKHVINVMHYKKYRT